MNWLEPVVAYEPVADIKLFTLVSLDDVYALNDAVVVAPTSVTVLLTHCWDAESHANKSLFAKLPVLISTSCNSVSSYPFWTKTYIEPLFCCALNTYQVLVNIQT